MSGGNYGTAELYDDFEYSTRYRFKGGEAERSNIPPINTNTALTCFAAFDKPYQNYKFNKVQELKDKSKFPLVREVTAEIDMGDVGGDGSDGGSGGGSGGSGGKGKSKSSTSGATTVFVQYSLL